MSRANEPAFPMLAISQNASSGDVTHYEYCASLTIREYFARESVAHADALLAELAKVQP